ncbi:MAG TPA: GTP-binding protein [Acetobacteraceae bacterium]|nr:GTP-binding protein [Acetobacteraceae bacterium]
MIPISIVTGFLGAGKTTLIARLLRNPAFTRTAVIVNEWGEVGLDHELIATSDETLVTLATGCLCCRVRSDLVTTLLDLARRRQKGVIGPYDRVLVETSGLADPAPILQALIGDFDVAAGHAIDTVLTLVDTQHGTATLAQHAEARRQVALADRLLLTKTDVAAADPRLRNRLAELNPGATVLAAIRGEIAPGDLFIGADPAVRARRLAALPGFGAGFPRADHTSGIDTIILERDSPIPALALAMWLEALAEHCGPRLLRVKGLVDVVEMPDQPAVVHAVRHVVAEPDWLESWPSPDHRTRVVIIAEGVPPHFPLRLLEAIEAEVRETTGQP